MFSTSQSLQKRTPENGIGREEYIKLLADEYYETSDIEAKEQVTANLTNFSYDPINYKHLKEANCIPLFLELLSSPNSTLNLHGIAGLCNISLDAESANEIIYQNGIELISRLLNSTCEKITLNVITTLIFLLDNPVTTSLIFTTNNIQKLEKLKNSQNKCICNAVALILSKQ